MTIAELLHRLGYAKSENYLRKDKGDFNHVVDYGHLFRKAAQGPCHLQGVYALNGQGTAIPVVYVCDVKSDAEAKEAHRLVWNQDTVPFVIVNSPETVRVYPGFCREGVGGTSSSVQDVQREFDKANINRIAQTLSGIAVDSGETWRSWGRFIRPEHRVDWRLLDNLRRLDAWLQGQGLQQDTSHALIGKYVYLHYLRDRDILSPRKLERFGIQREVVFGREATVKGLKAVSEKLDEWLNGEVFPIAVSGSNAPHDQHISRVAATFNGDQPLGDSSWQLHLDFKAYDFSYIPIEVLSIVYEQFLHSPDDEKAKSRGRQAGAYYTPIPVVNLMLSELEEHRPLKKGMRVFDPACGSGAFLVQAFRRLIEREFPPKQGQSPSPVELRELLEGHFYGLDTDRDACNVTRLSLILTLLDYVHPPDLEMDDRPGPKPQLPNLHNNIFRGNFFDDAGDWQRVFAHKKADWVVGNPPWKQLKKGIIREDDKPVLQWMKDEKKRRPVGNRQMARAFAWRAGEYIDASGEIALFLPAMTLFEKAAKDFRSRFLQKMKVHTIVNFSNLRWVISAGRFTAPAAAVFYRPKAQGAEGTDDDGSIRTYFPLVANQEATRPIAKRTRNETWSLVLNASEIRDVPLSSVIDGHGLPWKVAFWGSDLDTKLLRSVQKRLKTIREMERRGLLVISEGLQLRTEDADENLEAVSLPKSARTLNVSMLKGMRDFFALPARAVVPLPAKLTHARKGRAALPLSVCRPPHLLVSDARNFAVYSEQFLIVPARQIGISSPSGDKDILKALSVFLSSDFAIYFDFLVSTKPGVERPVSTLNALRQIPTPLSEIRSSDLKLWARLHDRLAKETREAFQSKGLLKSNGDNEVVLKGPVIGNSSITELNKLVYDSLGLQDQERALVHDMVRIRLALNDGKLGKAAVDRPTQADLRAYGLSLQEEMDDYICGEVPGRHNIQIIHDNDSGMVCINLFRNPTKKGQVSVLPAGASEAAALERCRHRIRQEKDQWVYFDRNLRVYDGDDTYILKPMQRFQWTRSQARVDAIDIVAESMARRTEV